MTPSSRPPIPFLPQRLPRHAVQYCRRQTWEASETFYLGSRLFPAPERYAVWAVYAACRQVDDLIDHPRKGVGAGAKEGASTDPAANLEAWWSRVQAAYAGHPPAEPVAEALAWAVRAYPVPLAAFANLRKGMGLDLAMDAGRLRYGAWAELEHYCYCVGGVVGQMIAPICGYAGGEATIQQGLRLGRAMQLTNILRDVGEDWGRGRLYLPADLMHRYGVTTADIAAGQITPQYRRLMLHMSELARADYAAGRRGLANLHGGGRYAVAVAATLYEHILDELEANDYDNLSRRAVVPRPRKLFLTAQAALRQALQP